LVAVRKVGDIWEDLHLGVWILAEALLRFDSLPVYEEALKGLVAELQHVRLAVEMKRGLGPTPAEGFKLYFTDLLVAPTIQYNTIQYNLLTPGG
jgi:hypothetical protein